MDTTVMPQTNPARRWLSPPFFVTRGMSIDSRAAAASNVQIQNRSQHADMMRSEHVPKVTMIHDFRHGVPANPSLE